MSQLPKISIITPALNSENTIRETIESVLAQDYPEVEHIVLDGGSTDGTTAILAEYDHLTWSTGKDDGHYDAMNRGIEQATGDVIVILNADDCYRPDALSAVGRAFIDHPEWDGLFGDVVFISGAGKEIFRREEALFDYDILRFGRDYICHHTLFLRRETYDRVGVYRHREFRNCCDYDLLLRLGRGAFAIGHVPVLLVDFRIHQFGQTADKRISENMKRESDTLRREHGKPDGFPGVLLAVFARLKRQAQKLRYRGKCDLIPGTILMRRYMRDRTTFSSNVGLEDL